MSYKQLSAQNKREVRDYAKAYKFGAHWPKSDDRDDAERIWNYFDRINYSLFEEIRDRVEFVDGQPYANQSELAHDVIQNDRLRISRDFADEHPIWSKAQNLEFRAVHDWHHVKSGGKFTWPGEKLACASHLAAMREVDDVQLDAALVRVFESECLGQTAQAIHENKFAPQDARVVLPKVSVLV